MAIDCDTNSLAQAAKCFCSSPKVLLAIKAFLLCSMATVNCDPESLAAAAKCFECLDDKAREAVNTYLLAVIAGGSLDPNTLAAAAAAFQGLHGQHLQVQDYLFCQIANA